MTGISPHYQVLSSHRSLEAAEKGEAATPMTDDNATLASYGVRDLSCIKVSYKPLQPLTLGRQHRPQCQAWGVLRHHRGEQV